MDRLKELISAVDNSSNANKTMLEWLESLVVDIESHQHAVRVSKTTAASVGVFSIFLLFTPLAPLGIAGIAGSAITGVGASIGDIVKTKSAASQITDKLKQMKVAEELLVKLFKELGKDTLKMAGELGVSNELATGILLGLNSANITGGILATAGAGVAISSQLAATSVVAGKTTVDLARISIASIETAASMSEIAVGGAQVAGGAARVGAGTVGIVGGALAGVGAIIGVADAAWSWTHNNPNLKTASELIKKLVNAGSQLDALKSSLENIRTCPSGGASSSKGPPPASGGGGGTSSSGANPTGAASSSSGQMGSGAAGGAGGGGQPPNGWRTNKEIIAEIKNRKDEPKKSDKVGLHRDMKKNSKGEEIQSNHVPPSSTLGQCNPKVGHEDGVAHSVGDYSHQREMCYGTTGSFSPVQQYREWMGILNSSGHMGGAIVAQLIVDYALSNGLQQLTPAEGATLNEAYQGSVGSRRTLRFRARHTDAQPSLFIENIDELRAIPMEWLHHASGAFSLDDYHFVLAFIEILEERWQQLLYSFVVGAGMDYGQALVNASHNWNNYILNIVVAISDDPSVLSNYENFLMNIPQLPSNLERIT